MGFVVLVWFSSTQVLVDSRGVLQFWVVLEESSSFALFWSTPVLPFSGVLQFALVALFALLVGFTVLGWVLDYKVLVDFHGVLHGVYVAPCLCLLLHQLAFRQHLA